MSEDLYNYPDSPQHNPYTHQPPPNQTRKKLLMLGLGVTGAASLGLLGAHLLKSGGQPGEQKPKPSAESSKPAPPVQPAPSKDAPAPPVQPAPKLPPALQDVQNRPIRQTEVRRNLGVKRGKKPGAVQVPIHLFMSEVGLELSKDPEIRSRELYHALASHKDKETIIGISTPRKTPTTAHERVGNQAVSTVVVPKESLIAKKHLENSKSQKPQKEKELSAREQAHHEISRYAAERLIKHGDSVIGTTNRREQHAASAVLSKRMPGWEALSPQERHEKFKKELFDLRQVGGVGRMYSQKDAPAGSVEIGPGRWYSHIYGPRDLLEWVHSSVAALLRGESSPLELAEQALVGSTRVVPFQKREAFGSPSTPATRPVSTPPPGAQFGKFKFGLPIGKKDEPESLKRARITMGSIRHAGQLLSRSST